MFRGRMRRYRGRPLTSPSATSDGRFRALGPEAAVRPARPCVRAVRGGRPSRGVSRAGPVSRGAPQTSGTPVARDPKRNGLFSLTSRSAADGVRRTRPPPRRARRARSSRGTSAPARAAPSPPAASAATTSLVGPLGQRRAARQDVGEAAHLGLEVRRPSTSRSTSPARRAVGGVDQFAAEQQVLRHRRARRGRSAPGSTPAGRRCRPWPGSRRRRRSGR